jgi:hypothetical protein
MIMIMIITAASPQILGIATMEEVLEELLQHEFYDELDSVRLRRGIIQPPAAAEQRLGSVSILSHCLASTSVNLQCSACVCIGGVL